LFFKFALALLGFGNLPPVILKDAAVALLDVGALGRLAYGERILADRGDLEQSKPRRIFESQKNNPPPLNR
jgi:hypothetical protein